MSLSIVSLTNGAILYTKTLETVLWWKHYSSMMCYMIIFTSSSSNATVTFHLMLDISKQFQDDDNFTQNCWKKSNCLTAINTIDWIRGHYDFQQVKLILGIRLRQVRNTLPPSVGNIYTLYNTHLATVWNYFNSASLGWCLFPGGCRRQLQSQTVGLMLKLHILIKQLYTQLNLSRVIPNNLFYFLDVGSTHLR